jgi:hypothetical protein
VVSIEENKEIVDTNKNQEAKKEKDTYIIRRHFDNKHTFEQLFAHIIKSHS